MWEELGRQYQSELWRVYDGRVPRFADLCCYWFEKARDLIEHGHCKRAGLLATQAIRGGANRESLKRIKKTGDMFFAVSDRNWILDGANVHVSMIGFDDGFEKDRTLDGLPVADILPNLTSALDTTTAQQLLANADICYRGTSKVGPFDLTETQALAMLNLPNVHHRPNSDVVRPWINGLDVSRRWSGHWIIDFGPDRSREEAAKYEVPFGGLEGGAKQFRSHNKREAYRRKWWIHAEPRPELRRATASLSRFLVTLSTSKHRLFAWVQQPTLPDQQVYVFARNDDYFFGVLHSRFHEVWARAQGTQLRERESGFRYTPTSCFETFPFPEPTDQQKIDISTVAKELNELRESWLNPPEWTTTGVLEFPGATDGPWSRFVDDPDACGIGTVRYPRIEPRDDHCAKKLAKRTLTDLYNERPAWLAHAHTKLDTAVAAAYGFDLDLTNEQILEKLLALNVERANDETKSAAKQRNGKKLSRVKSEHEMI
jgi:type II restriction/modification system DNA methylase subunit YeeA